MFPHAEAAQFCLEEQRWGDTSVCPLRRRRARRARASGSATTDAHDCKGEFTVNTGTIFERSHVPLHKWIYAINMTMTAHKGVCSMQMSKEPSLTQFTACFIQSRLREAYGGDLGKLKGVEIDETLIGGKETNKHGEPDTTVYTDELASHRGVQDAERGAVNYRSGRHVGANAVRASSAESMWAVFKRALCGTWHKASVKHMHRYASELTYRPNTRPVQP